jgi:pilus assembly protein FimV
VNISNITLAASLWALATTASALSLGGGRGNVVLGAPVDLAFDVHPDPGSDVASSCVTARLLVGDNAIGEHRVRISPLPELAGRPAAVRVQANIVVDEPVVTVTLAAGCAGKITRTYTFLPEFPMASGRSTAPVAVAPAMTDVARAAGRSSDLSSLAPGPSAKGQGNFPPLAGLSPQLDKPSAADRAAKVPVRAFKKPTEGGATVARAPERSALERKLSSPKSLAAQPPAPPTSRLVIEPLEAWLDSAVMLRTSPLLGSTPSEEPSKERAEAAALWKWLNAQNEAVDPSAERLQAADAEIAKVRAQAARDKAAALALQTQLETVERERFSGTVVYVLGGLLLLALALAAWMWSRMRKHSDEADQAWYDSVEMGAGEVGAQAIVSNSRHTANAWQAPETVPVSRFDSDEDSSYSGAGGLSEPDTVPAAPAPAAVRAPAKAPAAAATAFRETDLRSAVGKAVVAAVPAAKASAAPVVHIENPEELFDLLQQAEFFTSVGEHGQAIDVLKKHIAQRGEASPLAYFELLSLYHTLSRTHDFEQLRMDAMQFFNVDVPDFANFHRTGRTLFYYTDALAEIEAEWTSSSVLLVLERLLFRHAGGGVSVDRFDLAAYSDLLLLLSVAQTTQPGARGSATPRLRTTPHAPPAAEVLSAMHNVVLPSGNEMRPDPFDSGVDFDFDFHPSSLTKAPASRPATIDWHAAAEADGATLDLDLSDQSHSELHDLSAVPEAKPVAPGPSPIGFGMNNDLMELRLELDHEQRIKNEGKNIKG